MAEKDNIFIFQDQNHLAVQFPSRFEHINRVEEETRKFLNGKGLDAEIFPVCLAMREGLLNAVKHGNGLDPGKIVKYTLKLSDDILTMEIEDQGAGFDWQSIQNIRPSEKSEHGRGIFIMKRYFSEMHYNGRGNKLVLTKFSPAGRPGEDKRSNQMEGLAQAILQSPERIGQASKEDLFHLIEELYVRNNRLALQNAELRRTQAWMSGQGRETASGGLNAQYLGVFDHNPAGAITVDSQGRITEYSLAKKVPGGRLPEIGSVMYKDYAAGHKIDMHGELMNCIKSGRSKEFPELLYEDKTYYIRMAPFSGGAVITSLDITPLKQAERKFISLVAALEEIDEEIIVFDHKGIVEYANAAFLNRSGLTREGVIKSRYDDRKMEMIGGLFAEKMGLVMTGGQFWTGLLFRNRAGGREEAVVSIMPVKDDAGAVMGFVVIRQQG